MQGWYLRVYSFHTFAIVPPLQCSSPANIAELSAVGEEHLRQKRKAVKRLFKFKTYEVQIFRWN